MLFKKSGVIALMILMMAATFLNGCCCFLGAENGWYDISNFVMPDDSEFIAEIEELTAPWLIAAYMETNFEYQLSGCAKSPYLLWKTKKGDCNDFALFGVYVASYHGYDAYLVRIFFEDSDTRHWLGVYWEEVFGLYSYTSNQFFSYYVLKDIGGVVENYCKIHQKNWMKYEVYDYRMNLVEEKSK
ncbi:MAG: hypothetical protein WC320_02545 [Candidatus Paceibacterota bacterium]|jgi:hypothetical protein